MLPLKYEIIKQSTIPSVAQPVPMTMEQKKKIDIPVILFLGTMDRIVGDIDAAREMAKDYPNIQIVELESGHLIATEHSETVNNEIRKFLKLE